MNAYIFLCATIIIDMTAVTKLKLDCIEKKVNREEIDKNEYQNMHLM